jgi:hypothetical protein
VSLPLSSGKMDRTIPLSEMIDMSIEKLALSAHRARPIFSIFLVLITTYYILDIININSLQNKLVSYCDAPHP